MIVLSIAMFAGFHLVPEQPIIPFPFVIALIIQALCSILVLPFFRLHINTQALVIISLWMLFMGWAFLTSTWGKDHETSIASSIVTLVPSALTILLVMSDQTPKETFWTVAKGIAIVSTGLVILGIALLIWGQNTLYGIGFMQTMHVGPITVSQIIMGVPPFVRISSLTTNPNGLAALLMISLILVLALRFAKKISIPIFIIYVISHIAGLILTSSRTCTGLAITGITIMIFVTTKGKVSKILRYASMAFLISILLIVFLWLQGQHLPTNRFSIELAGRNILWSICWNSFLERPFTGVGFGLVEKCVIIPVGYNLTVHNVYLLLLTDVGLLGCVLASSFLLYGLLLSLLHAHIHYMSQDEAYILYLCITVILLLYIIHGSFENVLFRSGFHMVFCSYLIGLSANKFVHKTITSANATND